MGMAGGYATGGGLSYDRGGLRLMQLMGDTFHVRSTFSFAPLKTHFAAKFAK
jgi:hypothetical protein